MRKLALMLSLAMMLGAFSLNAQTKTVVKKKSTTEQTQKSEKPVKKEAKEHKKIEKKSEKAATTDKVVPGKKGPDGQVVYEGQKGGQYYINKNGNKTYLKK